MHGFHSSKSTKGIRAPKRSWSFVLLTTGGQQHSAMKCFLANTFPHHLSTGAQDPVLKTWLFFYQEGFQPQKGSARRQLEGPHLWQIHKELLWTPSILPVMQCHYCTVLQQGLSIAKDFLQLRWALMMRRHQGKWASFQWGFPEAGGGGIVITSAVPVVWAAQNDSTLS